MSRTLPLKYCLVLYILLRGCIPASGQNADIDLLRDINVHRNRGLDNTMLLITDYDYPVSLAIPFTELAVGYARHDTATILKGLQTVAGFAITGVITYALKYGVNRPRPVVQYPYLQPYEPYTDHSFPSGHTSFAFCAATSLSICYPRWYVVAPSYLWATAVGYSRLHLGVHYPSDVLGGAVVGAASAWVAYKGNLWLQKKLKHRSKPPM